MKWIFVLFTFSLSTDKDRIQDVVASVTQNLTNLIHQHKKSYRVKEDSRSDFPYELTLRFKEDQDNILLLLSKGKQGKKVETKTLSITDTLKHFSKKQIKKATIHVDALDSNKAQVKKLAEVKYTRKLCSTFNEKGFHLFEGQEKCTRAISHIKLQSAHVVGYYHKDDFIEMYLDNELAILTIKMSEVTIRNKGEQIIFVLKDAKVVIFITNLPSRIFHLMSNFFEETVFACVKRIGVQIPKEMKICTEQVHCNNWQNYIVFLSSEPNGDNHSRMHRMLVPSSSNHVDERAFQFGEKNNLEFGSSINQKKTKEIVKKGSSQKIAQKSTEETKSDVGVSVRESDFPTKTSTHLERSFVDLKENQSVVRSSYGEHPRSPVQLVKQKNSSEQEQTQADKGFSKKLSSPAVLVCIAVGCLVLSIVSLFVFIFLQKKNGNVGACSRVL